MWNATVPTIWCYEAPAVMNPIRATCKAFRAVTVGWAFEGMPMSRRNRAYWIAKAGKPIAGTLDMRGIVRGSDGETGKAT